MSGGPTTLESLLETLRIHGVAKFSDGTTTLEFFEGAPMAIHIPEEPAEPTITLKKGKDGLTAQEQKAFYGSVMDAEE